MEVMHPFFPLFLLIYLRSSLLLGSAGCDAEGAQDVWWV